MLFLLKIQNCVPKYPECIQCGPNCSGCVRNITQMSSKGQCKTFWSAAPCTMHSFPPCISAVQSHCSYFFWRKKINESSGFFCKKKSRQNGKSRGHVKGFWILEEKPNFQKKPYLAIVSLRKGHNLRYLRANLVFLSIAGRCSQVLQSWYLTVRNLLKRYLKHPGTLHLMSTPPIFRPHLLHLTSS